MAKRYGIEVGEVSYQSCPTHCCPLHGCKYGYDDCPVTHRRVQPAYPYNNGCEACEGDVQEMRRMAEFARPLFMMGLPCHDDELLAGEKFPNLRGSSLIDKHPTFMAYCGWGGLTLE